MHIELTTLDQTQPAPKTGLLPGLAALSILLAVGLFSVIPARAAVYPGFGWPGLIMTEASGTVGAGADAARSGTCNFGAALAQGLAPVCVMVLDPA